MSALTDGITAIAILRRYRDEEIRRLGEKATTMRRLGIDHWSDAPEADRRSDAAWAAKNDDMLEQAIKCTAPYEAQDAIPVIVEMMRLSEARDAFGEDPPECFGGLAGGADV